MPVYKYLGEMFLYGHDFKAARIGRQRKAYQGLAQILNTTFGIKQSDVRSRINGTSNTTEDLSGPLLEQRLNIRLSTVNRTRNLLDQSAPSTLKPIERCALLKAPTTVNMPMETV